MKRLVLIDGHAVLHRAYHALPKSLTTRDGKPVNAVYGFSRMLFKILADLKPTHLAVAFDLPKPTFRHKLFKEYQSTRPKMADDLASQIEPIHEVLKAFGIPIFEKAGFEADDVIGTLTKKGKRVDEIIIVTGDKDIFQLVNKKTKIYALKRGLSGGELVNEGRVEEMVGVKASQIVDYKTLVGDPSDNYPGVRGIGPKTAKKLLVKYGSLEKIMAEELIPDKQAVLLSQKLARIRKDVNLDFDLKQCKVDYDREKVKKIFAKYKFNSLMKELEKKEEEQMRLL
jgi:DNA polymerase-1